MGVVVATRSEAEPPCGAPLQRVHAVWKCEHGWHQVQRLADGKSCCWQYYSAAHHEDRPLVLLMRCAPARRPPCAASAPTPL